MLSIKGLISNLPLGTKRKIIGPTVTDGILRYYESSQENIDINEATNTIVEYNIAQLSRKRSLLEDMVLWNDGIPREDIKSLLEELTPERDKSGIRAESSKSLSCLRPLHDFQNSIRRLALNKLRSSKSLLIHMPTGSGKTRTASEIICDLIRIQSQNSLLKTSNVILWVAQSKELCDQAYNSLEATACCRLPFPTKIHRLYDSHRPASLESGAHIVVASTQTLSSSRAEEYVNSLAILCDIIVIDEAHRATAPTWIRPINKIYNNSEPFIIGLTATPGYAKENLPVNHRIAHLFGNEKVSLVREDYSPIDNPIAHLTKEGYLAEIEHFSIENILSESFEIAENEDGDEFKFSNSLIKNLVTHPARNKVILDIIEESVALGESILVFSCSVAHNYILQFLLERVGITAGCVDDKTVNRQEIIDQFITGDLKVLINFGVLTTGFDAPKTNACLIARPVGSIVEYSQMVGRILRGEKNTGNRKNKLFTIHDNLNHGGYDQLFTTFNSYYHHD